MRTLVISDLHLGARLQQSVLVRPDALDRLLVALDDVERLVLLGDTIELLEPRPSRALDVAQNVLGMIGARLGAGREVVVVPGNHDRALVADWIDARGSDLAVDSRVPLDATPALAVLAGWLAPAQVCVRYPGVWLSDRVWATHGHYIDRRLPRRNGRRTPMDYETARAWSFARMESALIGALPSPLGTCVEDLAELARATTMPLPRRVLHPRLAPVTSAALGIRMRRASIPTLATIAEDLGVDADWVLFGHVHRLGPLPGDSHGEWQGPGGRPSTLNTGSWVYEPLLVHRATPPHPYWPGGSVLIEDGRPPVARGLLDDLGHAAVRPDT